MATSTFDKSFVVVKKEDQRRILDVIHSGAPATKSILSMVSIG